MILCGQTVTIMLIIVVTLFAFLAYVIWSILNLDKHP